MTVGKIDSVYLLAGKDHLEIKKKVHQLIKSIFPNSKGYTNTDILTFFGEECDVETVIMECLTYPVFSEKKLVKVYDFEKLDKKKLEHYLENQSDATILILISSKTEKEIDKELIIKVRKKGQVQFFKEKYANEVIQFLSAKFRELGISYDPEVLNYLMEQEESSIGHLNVLVENIKTFCDDGRKLSVNDIPDILFSSKIPSIFEFIDTLFSQNSSKSLRLFHQMIISDENYGQAVAMIYRQLKLVWQAKCLLEQSILTNELIKKLNQPTFVGQKVIKQAQKFSFSHLEQLFYDLAYLDYFIKSGDKNLHSTQFEIYITRFKNSSAIK